ncbi:MAG: hypothetical protein K2R98_24830 [Gemmataceae bacterium]|nr:hypothetical protein [Gemmataceae bacterium]
MRIRRLEFQQSFPRPREDLFAFFGDAHNLDAITPPWLHFRILTPAPIVMQVGAHIEYRLRLRGIPVRWLTEITAFYETAFVKLRR